MIKDERSTPGSRGVDPYILAAYATLFVVANLAWEFAKVPAMSGARASIAYAGISMIILLGDAGVGVVAVLARWHPEGRRVQRLLWGLATALFILSAAQVFLSYVWPTPGQSCARNLLDHPNGGVLGSGILCCLAFLVRGSGAEMDKRG